MCLCQIIIVKLRLIISCKITNQILKHMFLFYKTKRTNIFVRVPRKWVSFPFRRPNIVKCSSLFQSAVPKKELVPGVRSFWNDFRPNTDLDN